MEWLSTLIAMIIGLVVRIIIPFGLTALMIILLKRLDEHWQTEAEKIPIEVRARNIGCWDINKCSQESRATCDAYKHPEVPCWQYYRQNNHGQLMQGCLLCKVFRRAPIPASP